MGTSRITNCVVAFRLSIRRQNQSPLRRLSGLTVERHHELLPGAESTRFAPHRSVT